MNRDPQKHPKPVHPLVFFRPAGKKRLRFHFRSAEEIGAKLNHLYVACQVATAAKGKK